MTGWEGGNCTVWKGLALINGVMATLATKVSVKGIGIAMRLPLSVHNYEIVFLQAGNPTCYLPLWLFEAVKTL